MQYSPLIGSADGDPARPGQPHQNRGQTGNRKYFLLVSSYFLHVSEYFTPESHIQMHLMILKYFFTFRKIFPDRGASGGVPDGRAARADGAAAQRLHRARGH